ncbi:hypothetical protein D8674_030026 [Pyrus ussuriensis x Pyrus communis]|uniref:NAB domain-containing protein n=1 Tax=Pyrus ussuriensis x Pyrus communis TaxID=2448454 RepID=A0A5N5I1P0_9ROSA|nr:hypothetical protein D8674_030026 [Pyrus ussuriensis x Pyrus communis]
MSMGPTAGKKQITMSSASSNPPPPPSVESSAPPSPRSSLSSSNRSNMNRKPPWLLPVLDDMEERMKMLASNTAQQDTGDTFAERAEAYYKRRPQLLSLLQDLYNAYLTLSDRYVQTIAKTNHRRGHSSQTSITDNDYYDDYHDQQDRDGDTLSQMDSYVDSSLSYQQLPLAAAAQDDGMVLDLDAIVTEIVMKNVECDILLDEANTTERRYNESSRKIELQKSLLEVLESERLILLHENAKLGYKMGALMEENKALASESMFIKRKAGELARCLLKVREDQRVCMLSRKIEDLQGQIYGLERRNKEYYEQLVKRDQWSSQLVQEESRSINNKSKFNGNEVNMEVCFQIGKINRRLKSGNSTVKDFGAVSGKKGLSWWGKVKNMDLFLCGGST